MLTLPRRWPLIVLAGVLMMAAEAVRTQAPPAAAPDSAEARDREALSRMWEKARRALEAGAGARAEPQAPAQSTPAPPAPTDPEAQRQERMRRMLEGVQRQWREANPAPATAPPPASANETGVANAQAVVQAQAGQGREAELVDLVTRLVEAYNAREYRRATELATQALALAEASFGPDNANTLVTISYLATAYEAEGRLAEAEDLMVRAAQTSERILGLHDQQTLTYLNNLGRFYQSRSRFAEAEALHVRVVDASESTLGRDHADTLTALGNLAFLYLSQRRLTEAEPPIVRVLQARERTLGRDHPDTLISVNNLALLYSEQGRVAEAEPYYLRAVEANERTLGREHQDTLLSLVNLASFYVARRRFSEAEPLLIRVLEASERTLGRDETITLAAVGNLADLYGDQGRFAQSEPLQIRSVESSSRILGQDDPTTIDAAERLAAARLRFGVAGTAIEPARLAVSGRRSRRARDDPGAFAEAQRVREQEQGGIGFSILADAAWSAAGSGGTRAPLTEESFAALQDAIAGTTSRAVIQMAARRVAAETAPRLGALVRERENLNVQWGANGAGYSAALAGDDANAAAMRRTLSAERTRIEARIDEIDAVLRRDFPPYFALTRPEALSVADAQAMLGPDEAILMVVPTAFGTHVMAISRTSIEWVRSDWTRTEVDRAVGGLLTDIRRTMAGGRYSYNRQTAFQLYEHIVAPVARHLAGKRHLFVVATGSLSTIPFGILVTEAPQGADSDPQALRSTRWFADAHALTAIPSIQSLRFLRQYGRRDAAPVSPAGFGFTGFGNPMLTGPPNRPGGCERGGAAVTENPSAIASGRQTRTGGMLANVSLLRNLCPLPGTALELENMRAAFSAPPSSVFSGARSTEQSIRTMDLSGTRILALATHGLVAGEISGSSEPGLVFTPPAAATDADDGYLTASEVAALRLDADWVILSACNTAAGDGSAGAPGLSGLARAFFYAGARNLLASHWPVADAAGARLTVRTIQLMQEQPDLSRAEALQRAMREIRDSPDRPQWAHPGVWGPFSLIGDGAH